MSSSLISTSGNLAESGSGLLDRLWRGLVHRRLQSLETGSLTVLEGQERTRFGSGHGPQAEVRVLDPRFYREIVLGGSLGAAHSYLEGSWECDELTDLFRIFVANMNATDELETGWVARLTSMLARIRHFQRRNTPSGSRRNIHDHYDLGNELFSLFLDPTMTYSAGVFEREDSSMEEASIAKLDRICRKLDLSPEDHVLEIGTGWGSFAVYAAANYGCSVTTTTISGEQYKLARRRIEEAGLSSRITLLREDYRDLEGTYDKLVSIEMIEAVGHQYLPLFFRTCSELVKPDGKILIQSITLQDQRYDRYLRSVDFIQHYIFPGSVLTSIAGMTQAIKEASDLKLVQLEDIGPHYARTLRHWRDSFNFQLEQVRELGYDERFIRLWNYYLSYCEAGFTEFYLGDVQLLLYKPGCRTPLELPRFRESSGERC